MRYICWFSFVFSLCFAPFSAAGSYIASITADGVAVRSGPGIDFYPVLQLHTGDQVEVYYEQGEWCAIRPPVGSFSWVSAQYIDFGSGNIGTVLADGLASRIGSDHSDDCETVQVALNKGETVFILERREMSENSISPVWLKIAPPSGEFRWIHRSAISTINLSLPLQPNPIQQVRYDVVVSEIPESPRVAQPERSIPVPKIAAARSASAVQGSHRIAATDPFQRAFNELQREAYIAMTRPTNDEVFVILIQRADELHQIAPTDHDLEKTYHLLESLQRTRAVRRELTLRRPAIMGGNHPPTPLIPKTTGTTANSGNPPPQKQSIMSAYTPTAAQSASTPLRAGVNVGGYDIVGRLGEFVDPLPKGHPPFAVVDEREQIICLISPAENVDLSPYVGQFVGINGILGFYERQPGKPLARHINAKDIRTLR